MSKVKVYSHRKHMVTLNAPHADGVIRCQVSPGMNMLDADAWAVVKEHPSVKKMMEEKMLEEQGSVQEKAKVEAKPVADVKPEVKEEEEKSE